MTSSFYGLRHGRLQSGLYRCLPIAGKPHEELLPSASWPCLSGGGWGSLGTSSIKKMTLNVARSYIQRLCSAQGVPVTQDTCLDRLRWQLTWTYCVHRSSSTRPSDSTASARIPYPLGKDCGNYIQTVLMAVYPQ